MSKINKNNKNSIDQMVAMLPIMTEFPQRHREH